MRVALDTNVLISAYTARGLSSDVFRVILSEHELVLSEPVLLEFERVLSDKFGVPNNYVAEFVEELRLHHVEPSPIDTASLDFIRDPDDRPVVAAAIAGKALVLITGDRDILDVRSDISGLKVFTPREFWEALRGSEWWGE